MTDIETKGIVWDLDGTILDSFGLFNDIFTEILLARGLPIPSRETIAHNYHGKLDDTFKNLLPGLGSAEVNSMVLEFLALQEPHYAHLDGRIFDDAINLAKRAHAQDLLQVVISNRSHEGRGSASPRSIITKPPLKGMINVAVCGDDNEFHKPDPRVLDNILKDSGLRSEDFIVVGDQFVDAQLAKNLGANAILVNRNEHNIPHLDRLGDGWENHVVIVKSLDDVRINKSD